jgi:hypothetical protein
MAEAVVLEYTFPALSTPQLETLIVMMVGIFFNEVDIIQPFISFRTA